MGRTAGATGAPLVEDGVLPHAPPCLFAKSASGVCECQLDGFCGGSSTFGDKTTVGAVEVCLKYRKPVSRQQPIKNSRPKAVSWPVLDLKKETNLRGSIMISPGGRRGR